MTKQLAVLGSPIGKALGHARRREAQEAARPRLWVQWMRRPAGTGRHGVLHQRGCWAPGAPDLHEEDVRALLAEPDVHLGACPVCRAPLPTG